MSLCRCGATIDAFMFETRRKLIARVHGPDHPFTPPRVCTRCFMASLYEFLSSPDPEPEHEPFELAPKGP